MENKALRGTVADSEDEAGFRFRKSRVGRGGRKAQGGAGTGTEENEAEV